MHICLKWYKSLYPKILDEAKGQKKWVNEMQEEIDALAEDKTWDLVNLPKGNML